jgi:flavodoxin
MVSRGTFSRRNILQTAASLPLVAGLTAVTTAADAQQATGRSRVLVAYLSRTGNTRVLATQIRRARQADMFEIETAQPYPEDYEETVEQARRERESGYEPQLKARIGNAGVYDTIYLGFPIWGMSAPSPIRTFLTTHDLAGKTLVPFITHGGYGLGDSIDVVTEHAPQARIRDALSMQADQERQTLATVTKWLGS